MPKGPELLPGETIICRTGDVLLTSDGWLAKFGEHRFEGITRIFRFLELSKISSVELIEPTHNGIYYKLAKLIFFIGAMSLLIYPFSFGGDIFWNGCIDDCLNENPKSFDSGIVENAMPWLMFSPLLFLLVVFLADWVGAGISGTRIEITHDLGKLNIRGKFPSRILQAYLGAIFFLMVASPNGTTGFQRYFDFDSGAIYLFFLALAYCVYYVIFVESTDRSKDDGSIPDDSKVMEFHRLLLVALGKTGKESGIQEIRPLGEIMGSELFSIKERLEEHDAVLSQIVVRYPDIFSVPSPYLGITLIRASTEILLSHRLGIVLPNRSRGLRSLSNYRDQIVKHDQGSNQEIIRSINIIISLGNDAVHSMEASREDYISALRRFVAVVEWHLSAPAKPVTDS